MVRTSVILAVIAAALFGYIVFFERGTLSTRELEQRKGSALPEFVRDRISRLEIQRKGVTTVLERDLEADPADDAAFWRVVKPYQAEADQDAVDTLFGELEWLDGRRRIEDVSDEDKKRFGLTTPRYRVWFTAGKTRVPIVVGNESPRGDGVYVAAGKDGIVHVVGKDLLEVLDQEPGHYHTKELHDGVMMSTTTGLVLRDAQGERAVRKRDDGLWAFERGASGLASVPAVQALIDAVDDLRAKRLVTRDAKDLARYGLDHPAFELTVHISQFSETKKDDKGKPVREQRTLRVRRGSACEGHAGESYVAIDDARVVHCAADEDLAKLAKSSAELRESRLLPLDNDGITRIELDRDGAKLAVSFADDKWSYEVTRPGKAALRGETGEEKVLDWLKALRAVEATRFDAARVNPGAAAIALRITRKEQPVFEIRLDAAGSELIALRGDEPSAVAFPASALELLTPEAARFRELRLVENDAAALRALELRRDGAVERVARADSGFKVEAPISAPADSVTTSEVARLLAGLEAVRFVSDAPQPAHGLGTPWLVVAADFDAPPSADKSAERKHRQRVALRLGAATEDGRYAELEGDPGVFVASAQLVDLLAAPLVARTLLSTPLERLRAIEVDGPGPRLSATRDGETFTAADGPSDGAAQELAKTVATLRASRVVGYGSAAPEQGLSKPYARITVTAEGESGAELRYRILLGAETEGGRYARRDDQPVTFVLPADRVDALLGTSAAQAQRP